MVFCSPSDFLNSILCSIKIEKLTSRTTNLVKIFLKMYSKSYITVVNLESVKIYIKTIVIQKISSQILNNYIEKVIIDNGESVSSCAKHSLLSLSELKEE